MLYLSSKNIIHRFAECLLWGLEWEILTRVLKFRDLAARNIIKTRQGLLKIIDFGLSSEVANVITRIKFKLM